MNTFCPACFATLPYGVERCTACGADLRQHDALSYSRRLVHALRHPLADVRLRVIVALGLKREVRAARALALTALRHPTDVIADLAIVGSLARMRDQARAWHALECLARGHPSRLIREAAGEVCARGKPPTGSPSLTDFPSRHPT